MLPSTAELTVRLPAVSPQPSASASAASALQVATSPPVIPTSPEALYWSGNKVVLAGIGSLNETAWAAMDPVFKIVVT